MATPMTFDEPARGNAHRWKVLGVGVAANASFSAALAGIPTTAVWLRSGYHLNNGQLGLALGALGLGAALSELPWGVLTDRWGDRPVLLTGLFSTAAALIAMSLFVVPSMNGASPALAWLVSAMCLLGLLGGSVNGSSGRAVMAWFGEGERGLAMSIRQTAVPMGGGIGAAMLPWLASSHGFAAVFGALAAMCVIAGAFAWRWLYEPPMSKSARHHAQAAPLANATVWRVVLGIGILCVPQFAILTFATVFMHDIGHFGVTAISATMAALQLGAMAMRVWSGRHTDRHGNRRAYMRASTCAAALSFVVLAAASAFGVAHWPMLLALLIVLAGICVSAWHGVAYTELATLAGAARAGTALGMTNTAVYAGFFITPLAIPHVLALGSWPLVWLAGAVFAMLAWPLFPKPARA